MTTQRLGWATWFSVGVFTILAVCCAMALLYGHAQVAAMLAFSTGIWCMIALWSAEVPAKCDACAPEPACECATVPLVGKPLPCVSCPAVTLETSGGPSRLRCSVSGQYMGTGATCTINENQAKALLTQALLIMYAHDRKEA